MSLKNEVKENNDGALEVRNLRDVQLLTTQSLEDMSDSVAEAAFDAVRTKSAQKLAFKVACHTDGIVEDARDLLDGFLPQMFVVKSEPLDLNIEITANILQAA